jgi:hypothetical protein
MRTSEGRELQQNGVRQPGEWQGSARLVSRLSGSSSQSESKSATLGLNCLYDLKETCLGQCGFYGLHFTQCVHGQLQFGGGGVSEAAAWPQVYMQCCAKH